MPAPFLSIANVTNIWYNRWRFKTLTAVINRSNRGLLVRVQPSPYDGDVAQLVRALVIKNVSCTASITQRLVCQPSKLKIRFRNPFEAPNGSLQCGAEWYSGRKIAENLIPTVWSIKKLTWRQPTALCMRWVGWEVRHRTRNTDYRNSSFLPSSIDVHS